MQHKKRVGGPPTSLSADFDLKGGVQAYDDFSLLGQQHKFASNVKYPTRPPRPSKLQEKEKDLDANNNANNNNNNSNSAPPQVKQIQIDDKQQQNVRRKLHLGEDKGSKVNAKDRNDIKENLTPTSPPPAPRKVKHTDFQQLKKGLKDKNLSDILPKGKTSQSTMNENVQTDLGKGVALSAPEAPANYSLKYKAGVAQPRINRKVTEYQKEYNWKKGFPSSPLLSAEQVVYNSAPISPLKTAVFPKKTEYQMQFKQYPLPEPSILAPKQNPDELRQRGRTRTKGPIQRSKSAGTGLSPDRMVPAGSVAVTSPEDPRQLRESGDRISVPKVPIHHGSLKRAVSEYCSNFRTPQSYSYDTGAWKDAYPPHLFQNKIGKKSESKETAPLSNWFAEVLELRQRANEYKKRAQGTHFSREHLVQLLAKQTGYWDLDNGASALSLDALALEPAKRPAHAAPSTEKEQPHLDKLWHVAANENSENNNSVPTKSAKKKGKKETKARMAWQERSPLQDNLDFNQNARVEEDSPYHDAECQIQLDYPEDTGPAAKDKLQEEGRLPTPILRLSTHRPYRHHLDRTTPSVGGLLLSSPPEPFSDRSGETDQTESGRKTPPQQNPTTEKLATSPILGIQTKDTHPLRDEDAESDHVMHTQFISSPSMPLDRVDKNLKAMQRRMNAKIPPTIDERMGATYNKEVENFHAEDLPLRKLAERDDDDDALSVSAMSIASSSSLASEVYERARKRRDEFWGKPPK